MKTILQKTNFYFCVIFEKANFALYNIYDIHFIEIKFLVLGNIDKSKFKFL